MSRGARVTATIGKKPRTPPPKDAPVGERRDHLTRFKKGEVHNPGGRPAVVREIRDACQAEGLNCVQTLIKIRDNENFPPITRIAAANSLLDRGYGRPVQGVAIQNMPALPDPKMITKQMTHAEAAQAYAETIHSLQLERDGRLNDRPAITEERIIDVMPNEDESS
jgi:hypothetical protein